MKQSPSSGRRVMALDPAGNLWGSERVLLDFLRAAPGAGLSPAVCCPPGTPLAREVGKLGIPVYATFTAELHRAGSWARLKAAAALWRAARDHRAELIYVNQAGATRIAVLAARLLGIPAVPHVRLIEDVAYLQRLDFPSARVPRVLAISDFIGRALRAGSYGERVSVVYDAFNWPPSPVASAGCAVPSLCCAGRLVPMKGQDILIRALAQMQGGAGTPALTLLGKGLATDSFEDDLRRLAESLGLAAGVRFMGFVEDVMPELGRHWAMVCPSHTEPLGRVIFEAWAAGTLPIAGAFSGGAAEVIKASEGGLLYAEQTPASLARTLTQALTLTREARAEMIERGRQWLRANCDPAGYARVLAEQFQTSCV